MTDEMINIIIWHLRNFSFASITIAFMCGCFRGREVKIFDRIMFTAVLTAFIAFYNPILDEGTKIFQEMTASSDSKIDIYLERCRTIRIEGDSGFFDDFITSLQANFFKVLLSCNVVLRFISGLLQSYFIVAFKILAPIVSGLAAWEIFRSNLWKFITYSLAAMMWSVGYQIADIFILKGIVLLGVPSALNSGAGVMVITGGTALLGLLVFLITLFIGMSIFYLLTPIVIFSVLSGANPGTAVTGNMRTAALASMAIGRHAQQMVWSRSKHSGKPPTPAMNMLPGNKAGGKNNNPASAVSLNSVTKAMGKGK